MPLNLSDLIKKAKDKGIVADNTSPPPPPPMYRTWQQESVLFQQNTEEKNETSSESETKRDRELINLSQSEAKLEPKLGQNLGQSKAKLKPNLSQNEAKSSKKFMKLEPKLGQNLGQNLSQSEAKLEPSKSFSSLVGLQRNIVMLVYEICQSVLDQQTDALSIDFITSHLKSTKSAVRKAIQRLEQKSILLRTDFKNGRGGWTKYKLTDHVYQEILRARNYKLEPNLSQSEAKVRTELRTELEPSPPSSSSFKDLKTTTTNELPNTWGFDIAAYAKFGFTESQLKQLASLNIISPSDVEQSLIEFSYDIENNSLPSIKTSKINFLMGLLRKGQSYVSEGFQNEQDAMIAKMAKRAEGKRKNRLESEFGAWESELTEDDRKQIEKIMPNSLIILYRTYGIEKNEVKNWMFNYFLNIKK